MTQIATNLSDQERQLVQKLFGNPLEFPDIFKNWITAFIEGPGAPQITTGQIAGFNLFIAQIARVNTDQTTATTNSYVDLTTAGPTLSGLPSGQYIAIYGANVYAASGLSAYVAPSFNGGTPSDNDAAQIRPNVSPGNSGTSATSTSFTSGNNTIKLQYKQSATGAHFLNRWLVALRTGR